MATYCIFYTALDGSDAVVVSMPDAYLEEYDKYKYLLYRHGETFIRTLVNGDYEELTLDSLPELIKALILIYNM